MAGPAYPNTYRNVSGSTPNTSKSNAKFSRTINTTGITFYATSSTTNGNTGLIVNSSRAVSAVERGWPIINLISPNQSFHAGIIKFFTFMTHIDLEK